MNRLLKSAVLGLAVTATSLSALTAAEAGDRWRRHHHHRGSGDLVAAGVLGAAVGALAAGVATTSRVEYYEPVPVYRDPPPRRVYVAPAPRVVYAEGALEPWTPSWYEYCESRYRSFNPRTGTFVGYDGERRFCVAN
ncbi:BA14K family protein [Pseudaminobacter sp. 19-2017]|uniref:Lectin-like protein BA14k n=1 Tax=Pseudaminobacter soli (ex Zhang et al. 2022) TaxID=2831468 RepID=A0A942E057_9HYPH|nr:BA14K family protein [Pseudaminobacter soli]MBS3650896.1 BA14K family protein [Pseudaminobacter soli]